MKRLHPFAISMVVLCTLAWRSHAATPTAPNNLQARTVSASEIRLSWTDKSKSESGFKIQRAPDCDGRPGAWTQIATVGANVITFRSVRLTANTKYWYRVRAYNRSGESACSSQDHATTLPKPPSNFAATAVSTSQINLSWTPDAHGQDGFKIERALSTNGCAGTWRQIARVSAKVTSYRDRRLASGKTYAYRVRAYNCAGDSAYSNVASATTPIPCSLSIASWGNAPAVPPAGLTGAKAIAAGYYHGLAVKSDGTVVAWGENSNGQATPPTSLTGVVRIAAGAYYSLALKSDGTVVGWGDSSLDAPMPLTGIAAIAAGGYHNLAVRTNGTVVGWGSDGYGQATPPPDLNGVVAVAAGDAHSLALKSDGTVVGWGYSVAQPPANLTGVVAIAASGHHSLALKGDGTVVNWGYYAFGETKPPTNLTGVVAIAAGYNHSLALRGDGTVVGWGDDYSGQVTPAGLTGRATAIAGGGYFSLALTFAPGTPSGSTAKIVATNQLKFSWSDNSDNEDGFKIQRALDNGTNAPGTWMDMASVGANVTNYADTGVVSNGIYWYRVQAVNSWCGDSLYSSPLVISVTAPTAPYYLAATLGATNLGVSWEEYFSSVDGFRLERATDNNGAPGTWAEIATLTGTNISYGYYYGYFNDTGVVTNLTYWYRVRAFNVLGDSPYSYLTTVSVLPPAAPANLGARPFADKVNLEWYNYWGAVGGFRIERAPDNSGVPGAWAEIATVGGGYYYNSYNDTGRALNTTYWYRVRAFNWVGDSPYSNEASVTILPPAAPYALTGRVGTSNRVDLSWYEYSADQDGFKLERAPDAGGSPGAWTEIASLSLSNTSYGYYTDTNATAFTTNWYRVRAFNLFGDSPYSSPFRMDVIPPPAPSSLYASPFADRINLSWYGYYDYYGNVDGFKIERAPDAGGSPGMWTEIATVVGGYYYNSYTDPGRAANTTYWYRVRAFNWIGDSPYSPPASTTIVPPAAPNNLAARIGTSNRVDLSWYAAYPQDQDGFKVERAADAGGSPGAWTEIATVPATNAYYGYYSDPGVSPNLAYWYRVRAFNVIGDSAYSPPASINVVPPPAPSSLYANPFADQVNLSWYAYYGNYGAVDGFKIERAPDDGGSPGTWIEIATVNGYQTYYTDTGRALDATYWYRVRAFNWVGDGDYSDVASATIVPPAAPYAPSGTIGTTNQVNLYWSSAYPYDQDGFKLERAPDAGGAPGAWTEIAALLYPNSSYTYFTDTNVTANTTNWYRVRAFNLFGYSAYSPPANVNVVPPPAPSQPYAYPFADKVNLSWYAYFGGYGVVAGFKIERAPDNAGNPGAWAEIGTTAGEYATSFTDTGRAVNTTYWYRVRAFNWVGDGDYSPATSVTILPPAAPYSLYGLIGNTNQVNLSWYEYPADEDGFKVERAPDVAGSPGAWAEIGTLFITNNSYGYFTDTNATANTTNWYRVRAFNLFGHSPYSDPARVNVVPPPAPSSLYANAYRDQINLSWYAYYYGSYGNINGFKLERAPDAGGSPGIWTQIANLSSFVSYFTDTGRLPNTTYWYRVRAFNWIGNGEYSPIASATIVPPAAPDSVYARIGLTNHHVNLSWYEGYAGHDGFKLERAPNVAGNPGAWTEIATILATNAYYGEFTDTNATANTTNWYRVRAFNFIGHSAYSDPTSIRVVPPMAPGTPYAYPFRDQINLSWYANNAYSDGVLGYKVQRAPDASGHPGAWTMVATNYTPGSSYGSYQDSGLTLNANYWYRVLAFNWIGDSPYSDPASATIVPPATPYSLTANVGTSNRVDVDWYDFAQDEDGFRLERASDASGSPGAWTEIAMILATNSYYGQFADTNVTANTTNWYRVRAFNSVGISGYSDPGRVAIVTPGTPYYLTATATASNRVYLYWYTSGLGRVEGYKLERATNAGGVPGTWVQIAKLPSQYTTYHYDNTVRLNNTYWYRVRAYNWIGDSPYSDLASVTVATPTAPANLTAINDWRNQIALNWADTATNTAGFFIERAPDAGGSPGTWAQIASVGTYTTNYSDTGRAANQTYWYRVRAYNAAGASPYSNEASAPVRDGQFVRVMQWNIQHHLGRPGNAFNFEAQSIARIVNYNQPDVLLFNEIDAQNLTVADIEGALIDWVTNSLTYLGAQPGVSFYVAVSSKTDGFNRNAALSRYPLLSPTTYDDGLRGLHSMQVQLSPGNAVQIFHAHLKCCADDCTRKQNEAQFDADTISAFAATNSLPYLFAGDWNEEEDRQPPVCTLSGDYHPITTIREGASLAEFKPTTLDGDYRTWSSKDASPSIRFDYILPASNRLAAAGGYVFNSSVWANRGLYNGYYYDNYYASDHYCVFANYYFADPGFMVSPVNAFTSSGPQNGPFSPASQSYTLSNLTSSALTWSVTNTANWLTASPAGGTLAAGATTSVVLSISAPANVLPPGSYEDFVRFLNPSNGATTLVSARLAVQWSPLITAAVTKPATGISATGAVLNGRLSPGTNQTLAWFEWGGDTNYGNIAATTLVAAGSTPPVALSNALSGLNADLVYHYRIAVSNILGIVNGLDVAFQAGVLPTAITLAPTAITTDSATLAASINPGGRTTTAYFQWGESTAYGNSTPATALGGGTATASLLASITGLSPTIYHYRAVASNSLGVTFGADVAFGRSVVDGGDVHQRIDGFGASSAWRSSLTAAQADMFFSTNKGIGLSLIRSRIRPDGGSDELNCMLAAQQRGAKVWSTPWSPPVAYKDSGTVNGGNFRGGTATNRAYAAQLARYAVNMKNAGINLYAISIQNEPDISTTYESCLWTADQFHDFIPFLYDALVASNVASVKIMMPEHANWRFDLAQSSMSDASVSNKVGILAAHGYYSSAYPVERYDKALWETEDSTFGDPYDGSMANGLVWAGRIHDYLTVAEVNAWHYWWLINFNADNEGLTDPGGNPAKRMYAVGQFSRFVRPGYYRMGVANAGSALVSAYQDTNSGTFAIVAINSSDSPLTQAFKLANFAAVSSVTPWITSASLSLSNRPAITVSNASFVYTLPAGSIVTFAGQATVALPSFLVTPLSDLASSGPIGGPFTPASQTYTLSNAGNATLSWAASNSASLVSLSASNGTLAAGASTNIIVSLTTNANLLPTGAYADSVSFINATDGNGNTARAVHLAVVYPSAGLLGFYDDFSTFASDNLVGQHAWSQALASSTQPLQVSGGQVAIPFGQLSDYQDAYKNFAATNATVYYGLTLTVNNAPNNSNPAYFAALYVANNGSGFANYRLSARDNGGGTYVLAARITGQAGDPYTFGGSALNYGVPYRVIVEASSGGAVMNVFVDPTSAVLADQTVYLVNNIGGGTPPTQVGSFTISQFGSLSVPNVGLGLGKACVADNFTNVYYFLTGLVPPPTSASSVVIPPAPHILSVIPMSNNVLITWHTTGGTTNVVQASSGLDQPFVNLSPALVIPGSGHATVNYLDAGALTNASSRFYRVRVQ